MFDRLRTWISGSPPGVPAAPQASAPSVWDAPQARDVQPDVSKVPPDDGSTRYVEEMAARLVTIHRTHRGFGAALPEVRGIGQRLSDRGGNDRMRDVVHELMDSRTLARELENAWDGIGRWMS